jgi:hypothetical protein
MLFTNGTGTGKTYTGLGVIYRFERQGMDNILIAAPGENVISDWIARGRNLGLTIRKLENTRDNGQRGIVITTYENLGANGSLAHGKWDLVVTDEAHKLMQGQTGNTTEWLESLRAITGNPRGATKRAKMLHPAEWDAVERAQEAYDCAVKNRRDRQAPQLEAALDEAWGKFRPFLEEARAEVAAIQPQDRARVTLLSASPFAREKNIDYAEGYLFDYAKTSRSGYNDGDAYQQFMMQHFGWRMRYNKLTEPGAKVDRGLMQRQFNAWLKKSGVLSGRALDVPFDYDRRFILTPSAIGRRIDEAITWLRSSESDKQRCSSRTSSWASSTTWPARSLWRRSRPRPQSR